MRTILNFFLSGYCFFFRLPIIRIKDFLPSGILLGGYFQALFIFLFGYLFSFLFKFDMYSNFLAIIAISALTGFFHEDGFADAADGLGISKMNNSEEVLSKLKNAMKDSRLGSYGVCALVILWIFRYLYVFNFKLNLVQITLVYLISRSIPIFISIFYSRLWASSKDSKSSQYLRDVKIKTTLIILLTFIPAILFLNFQSCTLNLAPTLKFLSLILFITLAAYILLASLSKRMQELSGDLIGATICFTEIVTALFISDTLVTWEIING